MQSTIYDIYYAFIHLQQLKNILQLKKLFLSALFLLFCGMFAFAQRENIWVFGNYAGVNFNHGDSITTFTTPIFADALIPPLSNTSVCDTNGQLLFYTNGSRVWDRNYNIMQNGEDIAPVDEPGSAIYNSATSWYRQATLIVPMPGNPSKYYIFSNTRNRQIRYTGDRLVPGINPMPDSCKLYYSVVDMDANGGLGAVDMNEKAILLADSTLSGTIAIVGDRCNIWILTSFLDRTLRAFEITAAGVNPNPVVSTPPIGHNLFFTQAMAYEDMVISPDRKKIAMGQSFTMTISLNNDTLWAPNGGSGVTLAFLDFNPATGIASNPFVLMSVPNDPLPRSQTSPYYQSDTFAYSVCFSPDGSKLYYLSSRKNVFQYDLSSGDSATIINSRTHIGAMINTHLRLGPNGKIMFFGVDASGKEVLGTIGAPNLAGNACQFFQDTIPLASGMFGMDPWLGMQNSAANITFSFPVCELKIEDKFTFNPTIACSGDSVLLTAIDTSGRDYTWSDDAIFNHSRYAYTGDSPDYAVMYYSGSEQGSCTLRTDSFGITFVHLVKPVIAERGYGRVLGTTEPYGAYQWFHNGNAISGATNRYDTISQNGQYRVVVWDTATGCTDTSEVFNVDYLSIDNAGYSKQSVEVYPNPFSRFIHIKALAALDAEITDVAGRVVIRQPNATIVNVEGLATGVYFIRLYSPDRSAMRVVKLVKSEE